MFRAFCSEVTFHCWEHLWSYDNILSIVTAGCKKKSLYIVILRSLQMNDIYQPYIYEGMGDKLDETHERGMERYRAACI